MENSQDSTKEDCFRNSVVKCKNSEAVEAGTCPEKLPITKKLDKLTQAKLRA